MSADTMDAHDDGLDEARELILKHLKMKTGDSDFCTCGFSKRVLRRLMRAIRLKYDDSSRAGKKR